MRQRLQKVLAAAGLASRRGGERLIAEGRVSVNGRIVDRPGTLVDPDRDAIKVDGRLLRARVPQAYFVLHKPRGYLTSMTDPRGRPTVADLIGAIRPRVVPVGRLDFNSEGLLLLTNDGALARGLTHPAAGVPKTYVCKVRGEPEPAALDRLRRGVAIDGRPAKPRSVRLLRHGHNAWVEVVLSEGRKHVVRRLLAAVGHPVSKLRRVAYGPIVLGSLAPGRMRRLGPAEVAALRRAVAARAARGGRDLPT